MNWEEVLKYLNNKEICNTRLVCKTWCYRITCTKTWKFLSIQNTCLKYKVYIRYIGRNINDLVFQVMHQDADFTMWLWKTFGYGKPFRSSNGYAVTCSVDSEPSLYPPWCLKPNIILKGFFPTKTTFFSYGSHKPKQEFFDTLIKEINLALQECTCAYAKYTYQLEQKLQHIPNSKINDVTFLFSLFRIKTSLFFLMRWGEPYFIQWWGNQQTLIASNGWELRKGSQGIVFNDSIWDENIFGWKKVRGAIFIPGDCQHHQVEVLYLKRINMAQQIEKEIRFALQEWATQFKTVSKKRSEKFNINLQKTITIKEFL